MVCMRKVNKQLLIRIRCVAQNKPVPGYPCISAKRGPVASFVKWLGSGLVKRQVVRGIDKIAHPKIGLFDWVLANYYLWCCPCLRRCQQHNKREQHLLI